MLHRTNSELIQKAKINGKSFTLRETNPQIGTQHSIVSCFIATLDAIAVGEHKNPLAKTRNAVVTVASLTPGIVCNEPLPTRTAEMAVTPRSSAPDKLSNTSLLVGSIHLQKQGIFVRLQWISWHVRNCRQATTARSVLEILRIPFLAFPNSFFNWVEPMLFVIGFIKKRQTYPNYIFGKLTVSYS